MDGNNGFFYNTLPQNTQNFDAVLSGIGRSLKEIGRSTQYLPYDIVGAPVDLTTLLLRPLGYNVQTPVGGSDWLIELARKYGIADKPTGSGLETLTRLAVGIPSPVAVPRAAAKVGQMLERTSDITTQQANRAADALVRQITGNPQATAPQVLQETAMPFMQAVAPKAPEAAGLLDDFSYRGLHTAPNREFGAPLFELNKIYPDDIYSPNAARLYGHGGDDVAMDKRTAQILRTFRGKPDAEVTIYRAVPKDETIKDINAGDWVTINKDYARQHGESVLQGEYKILERKVRAKDIWTNADSIHEFGYDPEITKMSPKEEAKAAWEANPDNKELYEAYRKLRLSE